MVETLNRVARLFLSSPTGKKILEEDRQRRVGDRADLVQQIEEIRAQRDRELPPLRKASDEARRRVDSIRNQLREAEEAYDEAAKAADRVSRGADGRVQRLQLQLRDTADPIIDDFLWQLRNYWDATRNTALIRLKEAERNAYTGTILKPAITNQDEVERWVQQKAAAAAAAEQLKYSATDDLISELHGIAASVTSGLETIRPFVFVPPTSEEV